MELYKLINGRVGKLMRDAGRQAGREGGRGIIDNVSSVLPVAKR